MPSDNQEYQSIVEKLLPAIEPHVIFDGWGPRAFAAAVADLGMDAATADAACPRGALDLAVASHKAGDKAMLASLYAADIAEMRYSERVVFAVRSRLEGADRELVRRATALFALPLNAPDGAALIWGTADAIWTALGDTSRDVNWYSKRAILSGVYGSTVLYWLGDRSAGSQATWDFLDRRIGDVMQFEKAKSNIRASKVLGPLADGLSRALAGVRAPENAPRDDLPGHFSGGKP